MCSEVSWKEMVATQVKSNKKQVPTLDFLYRALSRNPSFPLSWILWNATKGSVFNLISWFVHPGEQHESTIFMKLETRWIAE